MTFVEMHVKWSVTLTNRLGPEILTVLEIKGQVLHRVQQDRLRKINNCHANYFLRLSSNITNRFLEFFSVQVV